MAQTVLDKEKLDIKEISDTSLDNTTNTDISITQAQSTFQENSNANIVDTKSSKGKRFINDIRIEKETSSPSSIRKYLPLIFTFVGILLFICIFSTAFALININNKKIINGVSVNGISLAGLTLDEATQKLSDEFSKKLDSTLTLNYKDYKSEFIPSQDIDATYNVSSAIEKAYSIGRSGNLIQNNYEILASLLATKKVNATLQYNAEKFNNYIDNVSVELPGLVQQPSYYIDNENLIIVRGNSGIELLQDKTKELIISNIEHLSTSSSINMLTQNVEPNEIDINKIHEEIYSEPENAYIIHEPFEVNVGSSGIDFSISLDEATSLLNEDKDEYAIPLKFTPPEVCIEDLGNDIFVHNLGAFTSTYKESNVPRSINVKLATNKINNVILLPGEEFSYNKIVGERTYANGFREASVYTSSGVVNGLGGGICQVSSTLYNSVLRANLEVIERRNHRYAVSYVPLGTDATVAWGSIDFRFKNNRTYPIKIVASSVNGVCSVSIMGLKEETEHEVLITTKRLQTIPFQTKYIEDSSMAVGTQKQTQYGDNGYKYETYKTLKLDGNVISTEKISNDSYTPLTRVVRVGTKQNQVVTPPVETPVTPPAPETPVTPPTTDVPSDNTGSPSVPPVNNGGNSNNVDTNNDSENSEETNTP